MTKTGSARGALDAAIAHYQAGALDLAERACRKAVRGDRRDARTRNVLGVIIAAQGRIEEALKHFRAALALDPRSVHAATNLADAALNLGRFEEARATLESALRRAPGEAALHALMAQALAALGRPREALSNTERWSSLAADSVVAQRAHASLAGQVGEHALAHAAFRRARRLAAGSPDERHDLQGIARCLVQVRFDAPDPEIERELVECLHTDGVESQTLARTAGDLLRVKYDIAAAPALALEDWHARGWTADSLLVALLERTINVDATLERILVAHRRALLDAFRVSGALPAPWRRVAVAMALQCFYNEYVWPIDEAEHSLAAELRAEVEALGGDVGAVSVDRLICVALLGPLVTLENAAALAAAAFTGEDGADTLVRCALREPLAERDLAAEIPRAAIVDEVSNAVREQYEESPYPRWIDLPAPNPEPITRQLADQFPAFEPTPALAAPHRILIAGCGSGRHPLRVARGDAGARIVAIDLSVASLAYALRRAREMGIANVEFRQLDILDTRALPGEFSIIESSGVIHHMRDPAAGLAALAAKLRPGGVMKLGLYSRRARRLVTLARERIATRGLDPSPDSIRAFRADILRGRIEGLEALAGSTDLYALSACRDLLFHVQEHQFSPPEIGALLDAEGLVFLGFQLPGFADLERFRQRFPAAEQLVDLQCWDRFEAEHPATFANIIQLWCQKPA